MTSLIFSDWEAAGYTTAASGNIVFLSLVCLLQYVIYLLRVGRIQKQAETFQDELSQLESALNLVQKDRSLTRFENRVLREFITQPECDKALAMLLRRFAPHADNGFAVFAKVQGATLTIVQSRGLTPVSCRRLSIDEKVLGELRQRRNMVLEGSTLLSTSLWTNLAGDDRAKVRQVVLLAVGPRNTLEGVLMTTSLFPAGVDQREQIELAERMMLSLGYRLQDKHAFDSQQLQLKCTNEMLQLRAIADREFNSPLRMIEEFMRQFTEKLGADHSALFLSATSSAAPLKPLTRSGKPFPPGIHEQMLVQQQILAETGLAVQNAMNLSPLDLEPLGITSLVSAALVIPLIQPQGSIGVICFTRERSQAFSGEQVHLATWGGEFLASTILRALSQAVVERKARLDGLTELANRGTFDEQLLKEVSTVRANGDKCSLLLFDLDRFKSINDTFGHRAGDLALRLAADVLQSCTATVRSGDRVLAARYGGEELAVLLPGVGIEGARRIAESIRKNVEALTISFEGKAFRITTSGGLATFPIHAATAEELVAAADAALYHAKSNGRNQIAALEMAIV